MNAHTKWGAQVRRDAKVREARDAYSQAMMKASADLQLAIDRADAEFWRETGQSIAPRRAA